MEELQKVKESIDTKLFNNPLAQLQQRTWLIHWALFPLFNYEGSRDQILELFSPPNYINTIQTSCPWILRYLAAAVIAGGGVSRTRAPTRSSSRISCALSGRRPMSTRIR